MHTTLFQGVMQIKIDDSSLFEHKTTLNGLIGLKNLEVYAENMYFWQAA